VVVTRTRASYSYRFVSSAGWTRDARFVRGAAETAPRRRKRIFITLVCAAASQRVSLTVCCGFAVIANDCSRKLTKRASTRATARFSRIRASVEPAWIAEKGARSRRRISPRVRGARVPCAGKVVCCVSIAAQIPGSLR